MSTKTLGTVASDALQIFAGPGALATLGAEPWASATPSMAAKTSPGRVSSAYRRNASASIELTDSPRCTARTRARRNVSASTVIVRLGTGSV